MMRSKGLSLSQESLGAMFRLEHKKQGMNQSWRAANRLLVRGLDALDHARILAR
jgi:predicted oxidoreductase